MEFDSPEAGPHHYPLSFPGPRLVIRPGQTAKTLTVSADMETPGGGGYIRCFSMIDGKFADLGDVLWYKDDRKGREWRTSTFEVPKDVGIIRLEITPWSGSNFHVRAIKVRARFDPGPRSDAATAPASSPAPNGASTQLAGERSKADAGGQVWLWAGAWKAPMTLWPALQDNPVPSGIVIEVQCDSPPTRPHIGKESAWFEPVAALDAATGPTSDAAGTQPALREASPPAGGR